MRDGDKDLRKLVLDVLSGIQAGGADAIYEAALSDPDPNVVITAVENLGRDPRAPSSEAGLKNCSWPDSHPMLIGACLEALVGIGNATLVSEPCAGAFRILRRCRTSFWCHA